MGRAPGADDRENTEKIGGDALFIISPPIFFEKKITLYLTKYSL